MSQLLLRPGRNAARQTKKLKEIRKVKGAIQWHERERKKRQEIMQERWEKKRYFIERTKWENEHVKGPRTRALRHAKEDWQLGPLRPNRAFGKDADKYGALTPDQAHKHEIPIRMQRNRNEYREKMGLELEYPLIVDDKRYFPIVKDDRVVILRGKFQNKIGVVQHVVSRTHEVIIKGVNMQYYDSFVFAKTMENMGAKKESEVPIPLTDIRLVIPAELTRKDGATHEEQKVYRDVIVDQILMERHTTGIDPYTGTDYGDAEIPKEHQYDPHTGLPIFHRYIAGTRQRIEWPSEHGKEVKDRGKTKEGQNDRQTWFRRTMGSIRHPITSLKRLRGRGTWLRRTVGTIRHPITALSRWRSLSKKSAVIKETRQKKVSEAEEVASGLRKTERKSLKQQKMNRPKSENARLPRSHNMTDTGRNIVEDPGPMAYKIIEPPFPDTLGEELRTEIYDYAIKAKKDPEAPRSSIKGKRSSEYSTKAREAAREQKRAADRMKTPIQLRWGLEQAKKLQQQKKSPLVDTDALLAALGQHMQKNGIKLPKRTAASAV